MYSQKTSREVVLSHVSVLNDENFKLAKPYASDYLSFVGVLGSRPGAGACFIKAA